MTIDGLITNVGGQTSVTVVLAGVLAWVVLVMARRAAAAVGRLEGSVRRLGERLGAVEIDLTGETTRRRQLEQTLREHGIRLPYWPGDPAELYRTPATHDYDSDEDDLFERSTTETRRTPIPPIPDFPRHRREQHTRTD